MTELTEEQEMEIANNRIKKLSEFLIEAEFDFRLENWESGEGRDIIINGNDEDLEDKDYEVKFAFYNSGYVNVEVEEKKDDEK